MFKFNKNKWQEKEEDLKADESNMEKWDEAEKVRKGNLVRAETEDTRCGVNQKEERIRWTRIIKTWKKLWKSMEEAFCFVAAVRLLSMTLACKDKVAF